MTVIVGISLRLKCPFCRLCVADFGVSAHAIVRHWTFTNVTPIVCRESVCGHPLFYLKKHFSYSVLNIFKFLKYF